MDQFHNFSFLSFVFIFLLLANSALTALNFAITSLGHFRTKELLRKKVFFNRIFNFFTWDDLHFTISSTKYVYTLGYILIALCILYLLESLFITSTLALFFLLVVIDLFSRIAATIWPRKALKTTIYPAFFYILLLVIPIFPFLILKRYLTLKYKREEIPFKYLAKEKILEMVHDSGLNKLLDAPSQKILTSFLTFKEKVAREIMIPRVDIFALECSETIRRASKLFLSENYSRIPVYRNSLDNIAGILMYKDVLQMVLRSGEEGVPLLDMPIENFLKPVIYAPENKKISQLFQEFKTKQIHLAIIVNEYGGTEGIITIEDILEQLVGDIADEYDIDEECSFKKLPDGNYLVNAKMSIIDLENEIGIKIPHSPEYETIGGYTFHRAGTIPAKGWTIHHDDFEIEVLSSNERSVERVRIKPHRTFYS